MENFEDIVSLANKENDIELKYDLERNVNLVSFSYGKIDISFNEKLNKNFIKILTERLLLLDRRQMDNFIKSKLR